MENILEKLLTEVKPQADVAFAIERNKTLALKNPKSREKDMVQLIVPVLLNTASKTK